MDFPDREHTKILSNHDLKHKMPQKNVWKCTKSSCCDEIETTASNLHKHLRAILPNCSLSDKVFISSQHHDVKSVEKTHVKFKLARKETTLPSPRGIRLKRAKIKSYASCKLNHRMDFACPFCILIAISASV